MIKSFILLFLLTLSVSCSEKRSAIPIESAQTVLTPKADTLAFSSGVRSILQDNKGNYWFGSHSDGVAFYDGKSYEYFTTENGLSDNQVRTIQEDENGIIWFGTAKGISSYDGTKITSYTPSMDNSAQHDWSILDADQWFTAGTHEGVIRYDGESMKYLAFPLSENRSPDNSYAITGISKDKDGSIWFATYAGLFHYDGKEIELYDENKLGLDKEALLHIRSVLADSKGRIWIGNNGIGVLLKEGDKVINFSGQHKLIFPTSLGRGDQSPPGTLEHVFVITEDSQGNIWFGDRDTGVWKYDGQKMANLIFDLAPSTPMPWCIYEDDQGNMLFGLAKGGVYELQGDSFVRRF